MYKKYLTVLKKVFVLSILSLVCLSFQAFAEEEELKMFAIDSELPSAFWYYLSFEGIKYHQIGFSGKDIKGKYLTLFAKDIWNGKVKKIDTLLDRNLYMGQFPIDDDTTIISVICKQISKNEMRISFMFPRFKLRDRIYKTTNSKGYDLRSYALFEDGHGCAPIEDLRIKYNKPFPAFSYMLPYEKDGSGYYCEVDARVKDIYDWWKIFKIKHYIIFEMTVEDRENN